MKIYCDTKRFIREVIKEGEYHFLFEYPVVIDIGANEGTFSFWIYDYCDQIYAIEPVKENCDNFRKTIKENKLKKIELFEEAIADNTGIRKMRMAGKADEGGWNLEDWTGEPDDYRQVPAITMRGFMDREKIKYADLVKMDIEGMEKKVLTSPDFPADRIGTIIGEAHLGFINDCGSVLEKMGFVCYEVRSPGSHFIARRR